MARRKKNKGARVDFSNVGQPFKPDEEYAVEVASCTLEEGSEYPYFAVKFKGADDEHENSIMYHNASTAPGALFRLRPFLEALGYEVPEGPMDIDPADLVGRQCMCSTFEDRYQGGKSVKPDDFWPLDGEPSSDDEEGEAPDLDEMELDDLKELAEAVGTKVKGKVTAAKLRKALSKVDEDELAEAYKEMGSDEENEEGEVPDVDEMEKDDLKELADAADIKIKGNVTEKKLRKALKELDEDDLIAAAKKVEGGGSVSEEDIQSMGEEQLEELVEEHELDLDLSKHKTLRKKRNAVIDAAEEAGVLAD